MDKQAAIDYLNTVLPFGDNGEDHQCELDGNNIPNMNKLLEILKDGFGYLAISAYDPNLGEGLIFVNMSRTGDEYITVTPCTLNFKLMEAIYSILS